MPPQRSIRRRTVPRKRPGPIHDADGRHMGTRVCSRSGRWRPATTGDRVAGGWPRWAERRVTNLSQDCTCIAHSSGRQRSDSHIRSPPARRSAPALATGDRRRYRRWVTPIAHEPHSATVCPPTATGGTSIPTTEQAPDVRERRHREGQQPEAPAAQGARQRRPVPRGLQRVPGFLRLGGHPPPRR
jgi:hypothetical protein